MRRIRFILVYSLRGFGAWLFGHLGSMWQRKSLIYCDQEAKRKSGSDWSPLKLCLQWSNFHRYYFLKVPPPLYSAAGRLGTMPLTHGSLSSIRVKKLNSCKWSVKKDRRILGKPPLFSLCMSSLFSSTLVST